MPSDDPVDRRKPWMPDPDAPTVRDRSKPWMPRIWDRDDLEAARETARAARRAREGRS